MKTRAELKEAAKNSLKGKYGDAISVTILFSLITGGIASLVQVFTSSMGENVQGISSSCIELVAACLVTFGYMSFFLKISRNEKVEINELWSKTDMFTTFLVSAILIGLFVSLWTLLLIIPGIIASYSYKMTHYILLDNPDMSVMDAIKKSKEMMVGHKMDLFVLELSFIGWALLGILTCGILYLWLTPYMVVTECNFYNNLKELN